MPNDSYRTHTHNLFILIPKYFIIFARSLFGQKILGYPVRIDNKLYARNAFYFNFCFVFAPTTRTIVYEPVVRKLTEYMVS